MDINVTFTRLMLSTLVEELRAEFPAVRVMKHAWVIGTGFRNHWEFHGNADGPAANFHWHGDADNAYDARVKGWQAWRRSKRPQCTCGEARSGTHQQWCPKAPTRLVD